MEHALTSFEWHDLPVESLTFAEDAIRLVVTPFCDDTQEYQTYELKLTDATTLSVSIEGDMNFKVLRELEICNFDFSIEGERLSGEVGILPANTGYWKIAFDGAIWQLNRVAEQDVASNRLPAPRGGASCHLNNQL